MHIPDSRSVMPLTLDLILKNGVYISVVPPPLPQPRDVLS